MYVRSKKWGERKLEAAHNGGRRSAEARRRAPSGQAHPSTGDRYYGDDESEFLAAMERFKAESGRKFPTWSEALGVLKGLGYARPDRTAIIPPLPVSTFQQGPGPSASPAASARP